MCFICKPLFLFVLWCLNLIFLAKSRRQSKPYKPKKIIKMEGKIVVYTACNNGSSSVISKEGELYMFGKDAIYSDSSSKLNLNTISPLSKESPILDITHCKDMSRKLTYVGCFLCIFHVYLQIEPFCDFLPVLLLGTLTGFIRIVVCDSAAALQLLLALESFTWAQLVAHMMCVGSIVGKWFSQHSWFILDEWFIAPFRYLGRDYRSLIYCFIPRAQQCWAHSKFSSDWMTDKPKV